MGLSAYMPMFACDSFQVILVVYNCVLSHASPNAKGYLNLNMFCPSFQALSRDWQCTVEVAILVVKLAPFFCGGCIPKGHVIAS